MKYVYDRGVYAQARTCNQQWEDVSEVIAGKGSKEERIMYMER